jgi:hypothetical protein
MYFFDIDGTILDNIPHDCHFVMRNVSLFKSPLVYNPSKNDIRWNIITSRPNIDKFFIKLACLKHGIVPSQIFTYNKRLIIYNRPEYSGDYKLSVFKSILDGEIQPIYTKNKVTKIIHVCNNIEENYYINSNRENYSIISVNTIDFLREFFNHIV